jgi:hypothetical protein
MNLEELSLKIRDHLTNQKAQAANSNDACQYRTSDGRMCAVGCLLTDDLYSLDFEGKGITGDNIYSVKLRKVLSNAYGINFNPGSPGSELLSRWQRYHDSGDYARWCEDSEDSEDSVNFRSPAEQHAALMGALK